MKKIKTAEILVNDLPQSVLNELVQLQADGYRIYKRWGNGIELHKGALFSEWKLLFHILALCFLSGFLLFFVRNIANNLCGYRYRLFITLDEEEPDIFLI